MISVRVMNNTINSHFILLNILLGAVHTIDIAKEVEIKQNEIWRKSTKKKIFKDINFKS